MYEGIEGAIILSLIALITVFIILGLLALLMVGLRKVVESSSLKRAQEEKVVTAEPEDRTKDKKEILIPPEKEALTTFERDKEATIAVLAAAVASYLQSGLPAQPIRVISITRMVPESMHPWTISGRQNMMRERIAISARKKGGF